MNLPRLKGYLKFPDGFAAAQVRLTPVDRPRRADGFIRRAIDPVALQPFDPESEVTESGAQGATTTGEEHPSSNDDGAGKRVVPRQGELDLAPSELDKPADDEPRQHDIAATDFVPASASPDMEGTRALATRDAGSSEGTAGLSGADREPAIGNGPVVSKPSGEGPEKEPEAPDIVRPVSVARVGPTPDQTKQDGQLSLSDPRRLALEGGEPEPQHHHPATRDLGDFDIDI